MRTLVAVGTIGAALVTGPAGDWPPPVLLVVIAVLGLGAALAPDSLAAAAAFALVLAWWAIGPADSLHPMVLVAAALMLTAHVAAMLAASGPGGITPERSLVRLWVWRGVLVYLPVPVLYAVARGLRSAPEPPYVWVAGLAAACLALLTASLVFTQAAGPGAPPTTSADTQGPRLSPL
jgi:hypothetical protein